MLQAIARDLRRQSGDRYRVLRADSRQTALAVLQQLQLRNESVALFLVDQRMPQIAGVEQIEQASTSFPAAKRVSRLDKFDR